jgi:hypothetical protein
MPGWLIVRETAARWQRRCGVLALVSFLLAIVVMIMWSTTRRGLNHWPGPPPTPLWVQVVLIACGIVLVVAIIGALASGYHLGRVRSKLKRVAALRLASPHQASLLPGEIIAGYVVRQCDENVLELDFKGGIAAGKRKRIRLLLFAAVLVSCFVTGLVFFPSFMGAVGPQAATGSVKLVILFWGLPLYAAVAVMLAWIKVPVRIIAAREYGGIYVESLHRFTKVARVLYEFESIALIDATHDLAILHAAGPVVLLSRVDSTDELSAKKRAQEAAVEAERFLAVARALNRVFDLPILAAGTADHASPWSRAASSR